MIIHIFKRKNMYIILFFGLAAAQIGKLLTLLSALNSYLYTMKSKVRGQVYYLLYTDQQLWLYFICPDHT